MNHFDIAYMIGAAVAAPVWLAKPAARKKVRSALDQRMGRVAPREGDGPAVMIHAVSLGEINATRELITRLRTARPGLQFIVSTTTDTGFARGQELYGGKPDIHLVRFPLDFSWAVSRLLESLRPSVVALMELEVWPNFLQQCRRRGVPVLVINGRLTTASFSRYRKIAPLVRPMFRQLRAIYAQDETYAIRFAELGAEPSRLHVSGTMKFDTAEVVDQVPGAQELAASVGLNASNQLVWVCGSTGPGEESLVLEQYRKLLASHPHLRLVIVPRKPERFGEVAELIGKSGFDCVRRSQPSVSTNAVILGDTMGELRAWYSLADVVFVGRTLVDCGPRQHGSDMIEPAALAKPVIVGPFTGNFAEPMYRFLADDAMKVVRDAQELGEQVGELLSNRPLAMNLGQRARQVVLHEQGATDQHVKAILEAM